MPFDLGNNDFLANPYTQMGMAVLGQKDNNTGAALQQGLAASKKLTDENTAKQAFGDFFKTVKEKNGQITKQDVFSAMSVAMEKGLNAESAGNLVKFGLELTKDDGTEFSKLIKERDALPADSPNRPAYDHYINNKGVDPLSLFMAKDGIKKQGDAIIDYSTGQQPPAPAAPPMPPQGGIPDPTGMNNPGNPNLPPNPTPAWQKDLPPDPLKGQIPPPPTNPAPNFPGVDTPVMGAIPGMGSAPAPTAPQPAPAAPGGPQMSAAPAALPAVGGAKSPNPADDIQAEISRAKYNIDMAIKTGSKSSAEFWQKRLDNAISLDQRQQAAADRTAAASDKAAEEGAQKYSHAVQEAGLTEVYDALIRAKRIIPEKGNIPGVNGLATIQPGFTMSDQAQANLQTISTLKNAILKARSGGAVTPQEQERLLNELGEGAFKSDDQLRKGLKSVEDILATKIKNFQGGVSPEALDLYKKRGGTITADGLNTLSNVTKWVVGPGGQLVKGQ